MQGATQITAICVAPKDKEAAGDALFVKHKEWVRPDTL